jgi:hypothetical protein
MVVFEVYYGHSFFHCFQRSTAQARQQKKLRQPTRPVNDVTEVMKGLQEPTQLIKWDDDEA